MLPFQTISWGVFGVLAFRAVSLTVCSQFLVSKRRISHMDRLVDSTASGITSWRTVRFAQALLLDYT
jgi:hypothetical protein